MSSINWIHFNLKTKHSICREIRNALSGVIDQKDMYEITEDEDVQLCIDSTAVDAIIDSITKASEKYPEESIKIRYCASTPGAYHEIIGTCKNGQIEIVSDKTDCILDE